jgi:hypothetical protein
MIATDAFGVTHDVFRISLSHNEIANLSDDSEKNPPMARCVLSRLTVLPAKGA